MQSVYCQDLHVLKFHLLAEEQPQEGQSIERQLAEFTENITVTVIVIFIVIVIGTVTVTVTVTVVDMDMIMIMFIGNAIITLTTPLNFERC